MHSISDNIEIMINDKADEVREKFHSIIDIQIVWTNKWKVVSLSSILFIYCINNVIK